MREVEDNGDDPTNIWDILINIITTGQTPKIMTGSAACSLSIVLSWATKIVDDKWVEMFRLPLYVVFLLGFLAILYGIIVAVFMD